MYIASGLAPNSMYEFSVRDQDLLTETPFSAPFAATTTTTNLIELSLVPVAGGPETPVGTASLTATGSFSAPINIPLNQPPGMYNLTAVLPGIAPVSTELQVVAAGQPLPPSIQVVGVQPPATAFLTDEVPFTVSLEGFLPGTVSVFVDSPTGQLIGTAASSGPGNFTATFEWPNINGAHSLYAQETVGAQTLTATTMSSCRSRGSVSRRNTPGSGPCARCAARVPGRGLEAPRAGQFRKLDAFSGADGSVVSSTPTWCA